MAVDEATQSTTRETAQETTQETIRETLTEAMTVAERQPWLESLSEVTQRAVTNALKTGTPAGKALDDALNGVWLGHPLHPILVEIPVGAWTVSMIFDALEGLGGRSEFAPAADAATLIGLVGALGSAVTGLAQWQYTVGRSRRMGMLHALLNTAATGLYAGSLLLRAAHRRSAGRTLATLGYTIVGVSAYIGGELVYTERIGVAHAPDAEVPTDFTPTINESELAENSMRCVLVEGYPVLLARQNGRIYALANTCTHLAGPLNEGTLEAGAVVCPWHGSRFALANGHVLDGPAAVDEATFETRVRNGAIEVRRVAQPEPATR